MPIYLYFSNGKSDGGYFSNSHNQVADLSKGSLFLTDVTQPISDKLAR